jgi:riboflavin synthase
MFTGIVESLGRVQKAERKGTNLLLKIESNISDKLKVDQSVSHNGVCLTVTEVGTGHHSITAVDETLKKTNLGSLEKDDQLNLERCMQLNGRFDGHIVQGHVDTVAEVVSVEDQDGSWLFRFRLKNTTEVLVEKGSICLNGISLTCFDIDDDQFSVAIIPYTFEHTNFKYLKKSSIVNVEFDIIGKYIKKMINK